MAIRNYIFILFMSLGILSLSSCGVKPPYVDPPEGAAHDGTFPRTYPDTKTDLAPGLENRK